jgi:hypothetical protein
MEGGERRDRYGTPAPLARDGTPGRSTLTGRMPPSARAIARAVAAELRGDAVQAKAEREPAVDADVPAIAAGGVRGGGGALPHLDTIQRAFGHHDVRGVGAHVGGAAADAAAAIGARAYATGDAVAFASSPDLHTAAHEAAHVVQQRGGVRLAGGVGRAGDRYEQHADAVADLVVRGASAEALLDTMAHRGAAGGPAVQRLLVEVEPGHEVQTVLALLRPQPGDTNAISAEQAQSIVQQLDAGLARTFVVASTGIALHFTVGTSEYRLSVPMESASEIRIRAMARIGADAPDRECSADGESATPHVTAGGQRLHITRPGPGLLDGVAAAIAGFSGGPGDELEIEAQLDIPISVGLASFLLTTRVEHARASEHEAEGYLLRGTLQGGLGLGVPGHARAALLAGIAVEARGHDPHAAASMLALSLEHGVRAVSTTVADGLFGGDSEHRAEAGMREGDYADVAGTVSADARAHAGGARIEVAAGLSDHWRASGEHGEDQQSYVEFDLHAAAQIHAVQVAFDAHIAPSTATQHPPDQLQVRFRLSGHAGGALLAAGLVAEIIQSFQAMLAAHPEATTAQTQTRQAMGMVDTLSSGAQELYSQGLLQAAAQAAAHAHHAPGAEVEGPEVEAEVGVDFLLDISQHPEWHVRIAEEVRAGLGGAEGTYEHLQEVTPQ